MTNDEMRVVLAKWAGKCTHGPDLWEREGTEGDMELVCTVCKSALYKVRAPDYLNDLDAVATLRAKLDPHLRNDYIANLWKITGNEPSVNFWTEYNFRGFFACIAATPEQHCRALVATLNLSL